MMAYVAFDESGRISGFWTDDLFKPQEDGTRHPAIPADAIEIDEETHRKLHYEQGKWRLIDGVITEYTPPEPTTEEVRQRMQPLTARQLRIGLITNGIQLSQVTATINAMPAGQDKEVALVEWEYATTFTRMHPLIATVGAALGLTDVQIDTMWSEALQV